MRITPLGKPRRRSGDEVTKYKLVVGTKGRFGPSAYGRKEQIRVAALLIVHELRAGCPSVVELINYIYSCITKTSARENFGQKLRFDPGA